MLTTASNISFVLSGGASNINPNNSLGGDPSSTSINGGLLNNLFDDVASYESENGNEDYRCIYVFNDGETTVWDMKLWADSITEGNVQIKLGIESSNEKQRITIIGATGGILELQYKDRSFSSDYNSNTTVWASNIETSISNVTVSDVSTEKIFKKVSVEGRNLGSDKLIFDITWSGKDGKRNFDNIEIIGSELVLEPNGSVLVTVEQQGSPINTLANETIETSPPGGVVFFDTNETSPIVIARLDPSDGFPIWIKRIIPSQTVASVEDKFTIQMVAQSLEVWKLKKCLKIL